MWNLFGNKAKETKQETSSGGSVLYRYNGKEWDPGQTGLQGADAIRFGTLRDEVYLRQFGDAKEVIHEMPSFIPHVDVMEYFRVGWESGACTLVTSGMSDLRMNIPQEANAIRRVELIFYCKEPRRIYSETLRKLAHFPHDQKSWFGTFHTMVNGNPPAPLWDTESMNSILFLPPVVKEDMNFHEQLVLDGDGVDLLWVVPITEKECEFKLSKGIDALLEIFSKNCHPFMFDPERKSYV
jgi:ribosomal protein L27